MNNRLDLNRLLKSLDLDEVIPETLWSNGAKIIYLEPRHVLFHKWDPVTSIYLILYGSLRMQRCTNNQDENVIYAFKQPGNFLGIFAYLDESHCHSATAVALEDTCLLEISAPLFLEATQHCAALRKEVHQQIALNFKELQADRDLQREPTSVRLAHLILRTLDDQRNLHSRSILMKLTKRDLAKKIGSEPETVVRLLSDWSRRGIIKNKNRNIEVCDFDALNRLAKD